MNAIGDTLLGSDAWYGCQALVDRKLIRSSTVERSSTTTRCLLDEDDPLRASDPCCSYLYLLALLAALPTFSSTLTHLL